jgi:hypothetical protein
MREPARGLKNRFELLNLPSGRAPSFGLSVLAATSSRRDSEFDGRDAEGERHSVDLQIDAAQPFAVEAKNERQVGPRRLMWATVFEVLAGDGKPRHQSRTPTLDCGEAKGEWAERDAVPAEAGAGVCDGEQLKEVGAVILLPGARVARLGGSDGSLHLEGVHDPTMPHLRLEEPRSCETPIRHRSLRLVQSPLTASLRADRGRRNGIRRHHP